MIGQRVQNDESEQPSVYVIAGPNGAGKTTFANRFLPEFVQCREFLNADLIAAGLAPYSPESQAVRASELMLERIHQLVEERETFAFETTLGARSYAQLIPKWRLAGYRVVLFFLWLPTQELAVARVAARVKQGGHNIPENVIRRRFNRGLANLRNLYRPIVDDLHVYEASMLPPVLIWKDESGKVEVVDEKKRTIIEVSIGEQT